MGFESAARKSAVDCPRFSLWGGVLHIGNKPLFAADFEGETEAEKKSAENQSDTAGILGLSGIQSQSAIRFYWTTEIEILAPSGDFSLNK